jgi:hypothetical protein
MGRLATDQSPPPGRAGLYVLAVLPADPVADDIPQVGAGTTASVQVIGEHGLGLDLDDEPPPGYAPAVRSTNEAPAVDPASG